MIIPESMADLWIEEDVPGVDLTTQLLNLHGEKCYLHFSARDEMAFAGSEAAQKIIAKLGGTVHEALPSGTPVSPGDQLLSASGTPPVIHAAWRVALNLMEYSSGIATRTRSLVTKARAVSPHIVIGGTRKSFPGARRLSVSALIAGGGMPHRLGLGETVLFFANHYNLIGGLDALFARLPAIKLECPEKKIGVEIERVEDMEKAAKAGFDIIQADKLTPVQVKEAVKIVKSVNPNITFGAAGGVNADNAADYAAGNPDMLVTSWMYFGKPANIKAVIA